MEKKYIKVPFDVEMAKRIQNKECEGRIATKKDYYIRVVCWDRKGPAPIIGLIDIGNGSESVEHYYSNGVSLHKHDEENGWDLMLEVPEYMLEVPEYMTFKDGDIATLGWKFGDGRFCEWITILKEIDVDNFGIFTCDYVTLCLKSDKENHFSLEFDCKSDAADWARKSTEEEKQILVDALKESKELKAKEYLKRFLEINGNNR